MSFTDVLMMGHKNINMRTLTNNSLPTGSYFSIIKLSKFNLARIKISSYFEVCVYCQFKSLFFNFTFFELDRKNPIN